MFFRAAFVCSFLLASLACGILPGKDDPTDDVTSDRLEPTQSCVDYIACAEASGIADVELIEAAYGADSDCWDEASAALVCSQACTAALDAQELASPSVTECWGEVPPPTDVLFGEIGDTWIADESDGNPDCEQFLDSTWVLDGGPGPEFEVDIYFASYPSAPLVTLPCTLSADRTFVCLDGDTNAGAPAEGSGNFTPAPGRMNLTTTITPENYLLECALSATPE